MKPVAGKLERTYCNKLWRLTNLYKIKTKDSKIVKFRPNFCQRKILRQIRKDLDKNWNPIKPIRHTVIKYRQGGVSTFWLLWWLDEAIWHKNFTVGIIAHKKDAINVLFEIIRQAHDSMPAEVKPELGSDSKSELTFPGVKSKIMVALEIRSTVIHALHISEWCFIEDAKVNASKGAVPPMSGHISGESTGNGVGGDGYETYMDAKQGNNRYTDLFVPWYIQHEYEIPMPKGAAPLKRSKHEIELTQSAQARWGIEITDAKILFRRDKIRDLKHLFPQEFPENEDDAFLASGSPFFNNFKIKALLDDLRTNPPEILASEYEWTQWAKYNKFHDYVAGADPADGGEDYAVLKILDITTMEEVFVWRGRTSASNFADVCNLWGCKYNAWLGVEDNNMGIAVLIKLDEIHHYKRLYYREKPKRRTKIVRSGTISGQEDTNKNGKLGWHTDLKTKPLMLSQFKSAIEGDFEDSEDDFEPEFTVRDESLLQEALTFSDNEGKLEAQSGAHDDVVIASAICWQMALSYSRSAKRGASNPGKVYFGNSRQTH